LFLLEKTYVIEELSPVNRDKKFEITPITAALK